MTSVEVTALWIAAVIVAFLAAWFRNLLSVVFPSPQRAILAFKNVGSCRLPPRDNVRVVLAWLEDDYTGSNTKAVSTTFTGIEGIEFYRSARIISASGAADAWRPAMRRKTKNLLRAWQADIAVVGRVDKDGDAVRLWFVSSHEDDTLADASTDRYAFRLNRLSENFVDDLRVQIRTLALTVVIPKTRNKSARHLGLRQLKNAVPKLENLFRTLTAPEDRIPLCMVYVLAQSSLGEWLGESERLRAAVYRAKETTNSTVGGDADTLLSIRVNLARTLYLLGEREADPKLLEESVSLFDGALSDVRHPKRASIATGIQGLTANALRALAHLQRNPEHLHRAARLLESALEVHQEENDTPVLAITQNNLGLVWLDLANSERQKDSAERALTLFGTACTLAEQEAMPTLRAMTQNNTGQAHELLAELDPASRLTELEESRHSYESAVRGYSETTTPYHLASAKTNLGRVLTVLGASTGSIEYLDHAIRTLRDAHDLSAPNARSTSVGATAAGLGVALLARGKHRANARDFREAITWLETALDTYRFETNPVNWLKIKSNLAVSHFELSKMNNDIERTAQGFSLLEEVLLRDEPLPVSIAIPERYMAFWQGLDLVHPLDHESDYFEDWRVKWVPFFTKREHHNLPPPLLAAIQNDIAIACKNHDALDDAIDLYRRALTTLADSDNANLAAPAFAAIPVPPAHPMEAADVKRNLATALWMLGAERSCARPIREAIALFDEVLAAQDPVLNPMDWAITQSSKARAYQELYHVERDVEFLRLSLSAYDEALRTLPPETDSPWHQQVPGKREAVRKLLDDEIDSS